MNTWRVLLLSVAIALSLPFNAFASATTYLITVDTSSIAGTTGSLDFNFNPGPFTTQAATLQVLGFSSDGMTASNPTTTGNVTGALPTITFSNDTVLNDYFQTFTFGSSLVFSVSFSGAALTSPDGTSTSGSAFAFSIFSDSAGTKPALTTDTTSGFGIIVQVNLDGTTTITNNLTSGSFQLSPLLAIVPSANNIYASQTVNVAITVSGGSSNPAPTGAVTLTSGNYSSAKISLVNGVANITIPANSLQLGSDTLTAVYSGDSNYTKASGTAPINVSPPLTPSVTVVPSSQNIIISQIVNATVTVSGGSGDPIPTGTVTLTSGNYSSAATALTNGVATIVVPANSLQIGTDTLTATYSGDSDYTKASGATSILVNASPNPTFTVTGTSVAITSGATTGNISTITITPTGGFTGSVALAASITSSPVGAQFVPTLNFGTTTPVVVTGTSPGTAVLTISTTANTNAMVANSARGFSTSLFVVVSLAGLCFWGQNGRRAHRFWLLCLLLVSLSADIVMLGCGGGVHKTSGSSGTTPGSYVITVTGTSGMNSVTGTVDLQVQ